MTAKELNICMIAHRGYSGAYHQNTELAFVKAGEHASGGTETDIRVTKDGVLVCSHNSEAVFEDGSELLVAEATYAELTAKPLKNSKTDDKVYLCTFRRYLEVMKKFGMICFIELKGSFTDAQVAEVFAMAAEVYDVSKCILQSFDFDNLVRTHKQFPDVPLMLTYGKGDGDYERCFDYGFSIDADIEITTEKMVKDFHDRGLEFGVWTCNDEERFAKAKAIGVDYIESDYFGGND